MHSLKNYYKLRRMVSELLVIEREHAMNLTARQSLMHNYNQKHDTYVIEAHKQNPPTETSTPTSGVFTASQSLMYNYNRKHDKYVIEAHKQNPPTATSTPTDGLLNIDIQHATHTLDDAVAHYKGTHH